MVKDVTETLAARHGVNLPSDELAHFLYSRKNDRTTSNSLRPRPVFSFALQTSNAMPLVMAFIFWQVGYSPIIAPIGAAPGPRMR